MTDMGKPKEYLLANINKLLYIVHCWLYYIIIP